MAWSGKTGIPIADYPESFGYKKEIKEMNPDDFLELTRRQGRLNMIESGKKIPSYMNDFDSYIERVINKPHARKLRKGIQSPGKDMEELYIEYDKDGNVSHHEGRHRSFAANELNRKVPVHIVRKNYGLGYYTTSKGQFKKMTDPDRKSKKKTRFQGCERAMRSKGYSGISSTKICASIARGRKR